MTFGSSVEYYGTLKKKKILSKKKSLSILDQFSINSRSGDGTGKRQSISGAILDNYEQLVEMGNCLQIGHSISSSHQNLSSIVTNLQENGSTALGPAITLAVSIASQKPGSSVVVCTDGLANKVN